MGDVGSPASCFRSASTQLCDLGQVTDLPHLSFVLCDSEPLYSQLNQAASEAGDLCVTISVTLKPDR